MYRSKKTGQFSLRKYIDQGLSFYKVLDILRLIFVLFAIVLWIQILLDTSRQFPLDTSEYVDLEEVADKMQLYRTLTSSVLLTALFSLLQYSELNDKMALITRTVSVAFQDILYFMILAFIVFFVFALVGHLLFGGELAEWSELGKSINTAWTLVQGEYGFESLEATGDSSFFKSVVTTIYFYSYMLMVLLLLMNMLIAILMDGYTHAKGIADSAVEENLRFNVGPVMPHVKRQVQYLLATPEYYALHWLFKAGLISKHPDGGTKWVRWSDEKWMMLLNDVIKRLRDKQHNPRQCVMSELILTLKEITHSNRSEVIKQVYYQFQDRRFRRPTDLNRPFEEPDTDKVRRRPRSPHVLAYWAV
eukprot:2883982-Prymnesium_polylepis.1